MRRQLLIPQGKVPAILKFKPPTFTFLPLQNIVPPKNNRPPSNSRSSSFLLKKNLFSLFKTTPFGLEKGKITFFYLEKRNFFTLPPSSSFFSLHTVNAAVTVKVAKDTVVIIEDVVVAAKDIVVKVISFKVVTDSAEAVTFAHVDVHRSSFSVTGCAIVTVGHCSSCPPLLQSLTPSIIRAIEADLVIGDRVVSFIKDLLSSSTFAIRAANVAITIGDHVVHPRIASAYTTLFALLSVCTPLKRS